MRLKNKVAVITGGNSGMGQSIAKLFAKEGAKVVIAARRENLLVETAKEITNGGGACKYYVGDVSNEKDGASIIDMAIKSFGQVDILVNAAGIGGSIDEDKSFDGKQMQEIMAVNFMGPFYMIKYAIENMKTHGGGSIINICSIAAVKGYPIFEAYTGSKGALLSVTGSLAVDYAKDNIRVNAILPGATDTPMVSDYKRDPEWEPHTLAEIPIHFIAEPIDIAYGALYLASDESRFVTGAQLRIDGGTTA